MSTDIKRKRDPFEEYPFYFPPCILAGTIRASQSESFKRESSPCLDVEMKDAPLPSFFKKEYENEESVLEEAKALEIVSEAFLRTVQSDEDKEALRNAVFNDLLNSNLGLQFPPGTLVKQSSATAASNAENESKDETLLDQESSETHFKK